jgi:ribulose-5-phosphate 4-epimerase/fuculose-1-phosphate aldolase
MNDSPGGSLLFAARALGASGLVDAFGHLSVRTGPDRALITAPRPLSRLGDEGELLELPLGELEQLPAGAPKEAWIHWALYRADPELGAICRAQPPAPLAVAAVAAALPALHGQGALLGATVPVFDDARLVRSRERAEGLAGTLADARARAVIMRGNGAVAVGASPGHAVARMALLERSARLYLAAAAAGEPRPLSPEEIEFWQATEGELLDRLWSHLAS